MDQNDVFNYLRDLQSVDFSQMQNLGDKSIIGTYNTIDCWEAKFGTLTINSEFTDTVDLSYGKYKKIILIGKFNRVDVTKATVGRGLGIIDISKAQINHLDLTEAKVGRLELSPETVVSEFYQDGAHIKEPLVKNGGQIGLTIGLLSKG
jgi:hypothetical protein